MFSIIQSHKTQILLAQLGRNYTQKIAQGQSVFEEFVVLVPSMVLGDWLQKAVASEYGISTMITTTFWGQYQWQMMQKVLKVYNQTLKANGRQQDIVSVPEVAVLSSTVMQWRLFAYLLNQQTQILADNKHPLHEFLQDLLITNISTSLNTQTLNLHQEHNQSVNQAEIQQNVDLQNEQTLWQVSSQFAKVYNLYLTHRSEWLDTWERRHAIDIKGMVERKEWLAQQFAAPTKPSQSAKNDEDANKNSAQDSRKTPEWLVDNYLALEEVQRFLWQQLFAGAYKYRKQIEHNFWQAIGDKQIRKQSNIPDCLYLFTVQQLPISELVFLKRLSTSVDIKLFHYNPSQMFWADIVDKRWLAHQQIINPSSVYLREYGHTLLSRLGKQSRETFASLASLSGNEYSEQFILDWHDAFEEDVYSQVVSDGVAAYENSVYENSVYADMAYKNSAYNTDSLNYDLFDDVDFNDAETAQQTTTISLLKRLQYDVLMLDDDSTSKKAGQQVIKALQDIENSYDASQQTTDAIAEQQLEQQFEQQANDSLASHLIDKAIPNNRQWQLTYDDSLQIHSCYSLQRQLEVLRERIAYWLNETTDDSANTSKDKRQLSDIVVLLPDVDSNDDLIRSVFVDGVGQDGLHLPARITGVVDKSIRQLWQAICGYYRLLGASFARFEAAEVIEWLCLPTMCASLGLSYEQMARGCDLLLQAGFIRGFDEAHLQSSLDASDHDYRFSFAYALDKLTLGLAMPQASISDCLYPEQRQWQAHALAEQSLPTASVTLNDAPIIDALCRVYQSLDSYRHEFRLRKRPSEWIEAIEAQIIHPLFAVYDQSKEMRAIFKAMNGFRRSLKANDQPNTYYPSALNDSLSIEQQQSNLNLRLAFVLESIEAEIGSQQVSAESTGVITFARFGSLRTVPYKLVVMLNMNISEFPRQDKDDRYNLMQAGVARRGDKSSEDDDNGSFLDALLCANDSCWIFYNGRSLHDDNEHLPANPVSELMQFLQGEIKWQGADTEMLSAFLSEQQHNGADEHAAADDLVTDIQQYLPKLIENWLITEHPALPFSQQRFTYDVDVVSTMATINDADTDVDSATNNTVDLVDANPETVEEQQLTQLQTLLTKRLNSNKLAQQTRKPPVPLWSKVYQALSIQDSQSNTANGQQVTQVNAIKLLNVADYQAIAQLLANCHQGVHQCSSQASSNSLSHASSQLSNNLSHQLLANLSNFVDIDMLSRQVNNPAAQFLRTQQVRLSSIEEADNRQEPLKLTGLSNYQLTESLLVGLAASNHQDMARAANRANTGANIGADSPNSLDVLDAVDALGMFSIDDTLIYRDFVPAGVARKNTVETQRNKLEQQWLNFAQTLTELGLLSDANISNTNTDTSNDTNIDITASAKPYLSAPYPSRPCLTACTEVSTLLTLDILGTVQEITLKAKLPVSAITDEQAQNTQAAINSVKVWISMSASSCRAKHLLSLWLRHVSWQIVRGTTEAQVADADGVSICHFNKAGNAINALKNANIIRLLPLTKAQACAELSKWLVYAQLCGQLPIVMLADYAFVYLDNYYKHIEASSNASAKQAPENYNPYNHLSEHAYNYEPSIKEYSAWMSSGYGAEHIYDTCSKHPVWQYILGDSVEGNKAFYQLKPALQTIVSPLFSTMYWALIEGAIDDTG